MSYSCCDFVDTILDALGIVVPEESQESPSDQADLALGAIERLRMTRPPEAEAFADLYEALDGLLKFDSRAYVKQSELARGLLSAKRPARLALAKAKLVMHPPA